MPNSIAFSGRVLGPSSFELGEGPTYDPMSDTAWWFDIVQRKLVHYAFADDMMTVHPLGVMASALFFTEDGRQVLATETGLQWRDAVSGQLTPYLAIEADDPATRSNDARVHPCGALWFGTMGKRLEQGAGSIYHVFRGEVRRLYAGVSIPNAICFSPDGTTGYFADSRVGTISKVPLDPATGLPTGEPADCVAKGRGVPDGAVVDAAGCLWNARWGDGSVEVYTPEGMLVARCRVPARQVSCPAFVGRDASRLLVTTAFEGLDGSDPDAGRTFVLDGPFAPPLKGRFDARLAV